MNVALVNPIAATPAYRRRDFILRPSVPNVASQARSLRETNLVELGAELSRRGHDVTVLFADMYMDGREHTVDPHLRVVPVPTRLRVPFHPGLVPVTPELLRHRALREADVIQASEFHQPSTFFASRVARERSVPFVVWQETFRRMRFPGSLYQRAFESAPGRYVRATGRGFVPRTTAAVGFLRSLGVEDRRITPWIPTGIDTAAYSPRNGGGSRLRFGLPEDAHILLLVARLHRSKGVDFALRVVKWLIRRHPNVRLVVRGSGPELRRLRALAVALGVAGVVRFLGRLSRDEMIDLYNAADVVLCTSENDLLPFTLIEASACGRPSIASDVGAVRDIVVDGVTGSVIRDRAVEAFGQALDSLLGDDERRVREGREARERAVRCFALPVVADRLLEVYRGAAG